MIIYTHDNYVVGGYYSHNIILDMNRDAHKNVPIKILRKVTIKEYFKYCEECGYDINTIKHKTLENARFYEVSTD